MERWFKYMTPMMATRPTACPLDKEFYVIPYIVNWPYRAIGVGVGAYGQMRRHRRCGIKSS